MANMLDEEEGLVLEEGKDVNVINKKLPVKVGFGSTLFEIMLWVLAIIPGLVFLFKKIKAAEYFRKLEQKLQQNASQIDNYLEQRVVILSNLAKLVDKSVALDKETFTDIAKARSGKAVEGDAMSSAYARTQQVEARLNMTLEAYPDLKAHNAISDAIQQNSYLQREITAAREQYNDTINTWNREIQVWPTKMIVASKQGYTTRIPFTASKEVKQRAREVFF